MRALPCFLLLAAAAVGCATSDDVKECRTGADCPSGRCNLDGTCAAGGEGGGGSTTSTTTGTTSTSTGQGGAGAGGSGSGGSEVCTPNHDGSIDRAEVPLAAGLHATFRTAQDASVDSAGTPSGGELVWDLTGNLAGDHSLLVETLPLAGQWYAADFPDATYTARLSDSEDLLGVFRITGAELSLLGVVSPTDGVSATELTYDPPVTVLSFPVTEGKSWSTTATVTGKALGVPVFYTEAYQSAADVHGTMKTPFADFPAQRVAVVLTRTIGALPTVVRSFLFVSECFGTIATMVSQDNALGPEITQAAEVRRLAP